MVHRGWGNCSEGGIRVWHTLRSLHTDKYTPPPQHTHTHSQTHTHTHSHSLSHTHTHTHTHNELLPNTHTNWNGLFSSRPTVKVTLLSLRETPEEVDRLQDKDVKRLKVKHPVESWPLKHTRARAHTHTPRRNPPETESY